MMYSTSEWFLLDFRTNNIKLLNKNIWPLFFEQKEHKRIITCQVRSEILTASSLKTTVF
jgi:hypothetical protein